MNILFLIPYPLKEAPSQRFRFEQYFDTLIEKGHTYTVHSFLNEDNWRQFAKPGKAFLKILLLFNGVLRRVLMLATLNRYHIVFIHREVAPLGPPVFEWVIARLIRKRIIYDFDDAIWLTDRLCEPWLLKTIKWRSKVKSICQWSYKVSCGNQFLCGYALQFNNRVIYNPTTIDTERLHNPYTVCQRHVGELTIGWTGSNSTLKYLRPLQEVLEKVQCDFPFVRFVVIADEKPSLTLRNFVFMQWNTETEIEDLNQIDVGIMPLPDDEWSKGKCGFKALQYMALGIPTVASPVGVNTVIVDHGINGFMASTPEDWYKYLSLLVEDEQLRKKLGKNGRRKVIDHYSVRSNESKFLSLFA